MKNKYKAKNAELLITDSRAAQQFHLGLWFACPTN